MNIDSLRECIHLSSTLSFTETAKHFYITQPVLSKHIANIEREIGFKIFMRTKNGVHLTSAGHSFVADCARIIEQYDTALERAWDIKAGKDSFINIGYLHGAASTILPRALKRFKKSNPSVEVKFSALEIDEVPGQLSENVIDLAITCNLDRFDLDRYYQTELYPDALCLIVPKGHRLSDRKAIDVDDLAGEDILLPRTSFMPNESTYINEILSPVKDSVKPKRLIGDLPSIMMAIMTEGCIAIEFQHLRNIYDLDEVSFIPIQANIPTFSVVAVWKRTHDTEALRNLVGELSRQCEIQHLN